MNISKVLSLQHAINIKIVNELFYILYFVQFFKIQYVLYTYSMFWCELATFQVLIHYDLLLATCTVLDREKGGGGNRVLMYKTGFPILVILNSSIFMLKGEHNF